MERSIGLDKFHLKKSIKILRVRPNQLFKFKNNQFTYIVEK